MKNYKISNDLKKSILKAYKYHAEESEEYAINTFIDDCKRYIKANKKGMLYYSFVDHTKSGALHFKPLEILPNYPLNFYAMFESFEYEVSQKDDTAFKVDFMNMNQAFQIHYSLMGQFKNMGLITKKTFDVLSQKTPSLI